MKNPAPLLPILTVAQLRALEATQTAAQPPLMERAGLAAAGFALELLAGRGGCVLVLAGPGNNGGDGFVMARELLARGVDVVVACVARPEKMPPDARGARQRWLDAGGQIVTDFIGTQWALAVDALFGIGLGRPLAGLYAEWVGRFNALTCPRLALDIPSGLDADTGRGDGPTVTATHTASFIAHKPGLLTLDGPDHCGELRVFDLALAAAGEGAVLGLACFAAHLHARRHNVHKGLYGAVGVIGGAAGMLGAAFLTARAALHLGPGKVFLGLLDAQAPALDLAFPEVMLRVPGEVTQLASAVAIGPGLGVDEAAGVQLRRALGFDGPLLVDADGLNLVAREPALAEVLAARRAETVLTPHPAEAARLLRCSVAEVQADRLAAAQGLACRLRAVVVLKGCGSVIATPDKAWFINPTGHGGMASGGMGDALSGLLVALLAQGWPALAAAQCAVYLHGAAADRLAREGVGPVGLRASETLSAARRIFNAWLQADGPAS